MTQIEAVGLREQILAVERRIARFNNVTTVEKTAMFGDSSDHYVLADQGKLQAFKRLSYPSVNRFDHLVTAQKVEQMIQDALDAQQVVTRNSYALNYLNKLVSAVNECDATGAETRIDIDKDDDTPVKNIIGQNFPTLSGRFDKAIQAGKKDGLGALFGYLQVETEVLPKISKKSAQTKGYISAPQTNTFWLHTSLDGVIVEYTYVDEHAPQVALVISPLKAQSAF